MESYTIFMFIRYYYKDVTAPQLIYRFKASRLKVNMGSFLSTT